MKYLLDTDICIYIIKKKHPNILKKLTATDHGDMAISSVTIAELQYGIAKSQQPHQNTLALIHFVTPFHILDFDANAAIEYGVIRANLERAGKVIGPYDMQIAAQAIANGVTLVTNNSKEFKRIDGLKTVNWTHS